jgi:DNA-binding MarR family transcriptional regulator
MDGSPAEDRLLDAERDVLEALRGQSFDFESMDAISNIYRAASAVRARAEREVLSEHGLTWGGFTILWVLRVWKAMETARLADECGLAKGTLTGMLHTLERRDLVRRERIAADRRRVLVDLTPAGRGLIDAVLPTFNRFEGTMSDGLTKSEKRELARLLRVVIHRAAD